MSENGISERLNEHISKLESSSEKVRKTSMLYGHVNEVHKNVIPKIKLKLIARSPGDATKRQAIEAVSIRENNPILNAKEEWSNQPRKRKERSS